jgi:hypothetical protein
MNRRQFLALGTAATAAMVLDPERLLWVPGARTFFIPDKTVVEAKTMEQALVRGLVAMVPNGHGGWCEVEVQLRAGMGMTLDERFRRELATIAAMGGRVVERREYNYQRRLSSGVMQHVWRG